MAIWLPTRMSTTKAAPVTAPRRSRTVVDISFLPQAGTVGQPAHQHPPGPVPSSWVPQSRPVPAQETGVRLAACRRKRPRTVPQGWLTRVPIAVWADGCLELPAECWPVDFLGRAVSSFPDLVSCLSGSRPAVRRGRRPGALSRSRLRRRDDPQGQGSDHGDTPGFRPTSWPCGIRQGTQPTAADIIQRAGTGRRVRASSAGRCLSSIRLMRSTGTAMLHRSSSQLAALV